MRIQSAICGMAALVTIPAWAQSAQPDPQPTSIVRAAPLPAERLHAMRQALMARIAAYDTAERSFRAPTAAEQSELSRTAPSTAAPRIVALRGGGVAVSGDVAELSLLVVDLQPDGKAILRHGHGPKQAAASEQGGHHGN